MREYVRRTIAELEQEIADLTVARDALLRLSAAPSAPAATSAPAKRSRAKPLSLHHVKPREALAAAMKVKPTATAATADDDALTDTQRKVCAYLEKSGAKQAGDIAEHALGSRSKAGVVSGKTMPAMRRLGLVLEDHGFWRLSDKGFEAALA